MDKTESQSAIPAPESPAERKLRMEAEKLQAEIEAIRRPLYKTPSFYTALSPVLLAALGVIFTWASGWFDTQRKSIEADKKLLTIETKELEQKKHQQQALIDGLSSEKSVLTAQIAEMQTERGELRRQLQQLVNEKTSFTNQIALLENERNEIRLAKEAVEAEAKRLAGSETNATAYLTQLKELQTEREQVQRYLQRQSYIDGGREMELHGALLANLVATREFLQIKTPTASQRNNYLMGVEYRADNDYYGKSYEHWVPSYLESATNLPQSWRGQFDSKRIQAEIYEAQLSRPAEDEKADAAIRLKSFQQYMDEALARQKTNK